MSTQVDRLVVTPYSQKVVPISNGVGAKPPTGRGGNKSTVNKTPTTLEATKPHQGGTISVRKINTGKDMKPVLVGKYKSVRKKSGKNCFEVFPFSLVEHIFFLFSVS